MQVNLSANTPNSAVEAMTPKSAEKTDSELKGTFFAQMGQILNPDNGDRGDQAEEKPAEQVSVGTCKDSTNLLLGVPLISENSTDTGDLPDPNSPVLNNSAPSMTTLWTLPMVTPTFPESTGFQMEMRGAKDPFIKSASIDIQSDLQGTIARGENSKSAFGSETGILPDDTGTSQKMILQSNLSFPSESSVEPEPAVDAADIELSMNPDVPDADFQPPSPEKLEGTLQGELHSAKNAHHKEFASTISSAAENVPSPSNSGWTQTMPFESRQPVHTRSVTNASPEALTPEADLSISRDAKQQIESLHGPSSRKLEVIGNPALENAGAGDSRPDQDPSRNQSASWIALHSKMAGSQADSVRAQVSITEHQKEGLAQSTSSPVHLAESGKVTVIGPSAQTSGSQPKELMLQLAERIQIQLRDGRSEIRIQLKPDGLGHLDIRAESTINGVVARIVVESSRVKEYLESNLPVLQQSLQDQGLRVDRIQVAVQDGFDPQSSSGYSAQFGHTGSGHNGSESRKASTIPESAAADQLEEMIVDPMMWISLNPNSRFHTIA